MKNNKIILFTLFFILLHSFSFSQDSIPENKDLTEEAELKFQQYFLRLYLKKR